MSTEIRSSRLAAGSGARRGGCRRRCVPACACRRRSAARSARWLRSGLSRVPASRPVAARSRDCSATAVPSRRRRRRPVASGRGRRGCRGGACCARVGIGACCSRLGAGRAPARPPAQPEPAVTSSVAPVGRGSCVVLLPLPSEPGQVVPLLVVARAGAASTGRHARPGCRPRAADVENHGHGHQGLAVQGISAGGQGPRRRLPSGRGAQAAAGRSRARRARTARRRWLRRAQAHGSTSA